MSKTTYFISNVYVTSFEMESKISVKGKLDALDFIINTLIEHENRLDILIERMEKSTELIQDMIKTRKYSQISE